MKPYANKSDEVICLGCNDLIAVFNRDMFYGEALIPEIFDPSKGQAPWKDGEICMCRKCDRQFHLLPDEIFKDGSNSIK